MRLDRGTLAKADRRLLAELPHDVGVQLVKVPVSDAVWSTWRRYCEVAGVHMGEGLAILLRHELASLADEDVETLADRLNAQQSDLKASNDDLASTRKELERRTRQLAIRESHLGERMRDLEGREKNVAIVEHQLAQELLKLKGSPAQRLGIKPGRNEPCWCRSGKKYKYCHGRPT